VKYTDNEGIICTVYIRDPQTFFSQDTHVRLADYCYILIRIKLISKEHRAMHLNLLDFEFMNLIISLE
jgi:hypothetical protein